MTALPFFQVDAFVTGSLTGNPAAIMPLEHWLDDALMQAIAAENNLSETAFTVPSENANATSICAGSRQSMRSFVRSCDDRRRPRPRRWRAGPFFDAFRDPPCAPRRQFVGARPSRGRARRGARASVVRRARPVRPCDLARRRVQRAAIVPVDDEAAVRGVAPDFAALRTIHRMAVVTAPGDSHTIASRVFVSYCGIDEDPVTGSAHAALVPYWSERLGRREFTAIQASRRDGELQCRLEGDRVILGGKCRTVIVGNFQL